MLSSLILSHLDYESSADLRIEIHSFDAPPSGETSA
jgi:hypothetical protein